jgi:phospholipase C
MKYRIICFVAGLVMAGNVMAAVKTATGIEHVIVIVGENRSFDNLFATYRPRKGQTIGNLLSRGIVKENGRPGRNFYGYVTVNC